MSVGLALLCGLVLSLFPFQFRAHPRANWLNFFRHPDLYESAATACPPGLAVAFAPGAWTGALALRGRLALVERDGPVGKACVYLRAEDGVGRREVFDATPPVLAGFAAEHGFAFE